MAMIALTSGGFDVIPEGNTVFCIENVDYKERFGKLSIRMVTADGKVHNNTFGLLDAKTKQPSQGALSAFSFFAKTAMNDFSLSEVDPTELIGKYIRADVKHDVKPSTKNPGETVTFIKLDNQKPATGFDDVPATEPAETTAAYDLNSLLG